MAHKPDITALLSEVEQGNAEVVNTLLPLLYDELSVLARHQLGQYRPGQTLNTTALVHEAYLKLLNQEDASFPNRRHFFALASKAMRQIVVDHARRRKAQKRGGGTRRVPLEMLDGASSIPVEAQAESLLAIDLALTKLGNLDERLVQVVELRFFGGLSVEETAEVLEVSPPTVVRHTRIARAFLYRELEKSPDP